MVEYETTNLRAKTVERVVENTKGRVDQLKRDGLGSSADRLERMRDEAQEIVQETDNSGQFVSVPCHLASTLASDSRPTVPEIGNKLREINYWG